jgi:SAM-dependent methyltransferase
MKSQNSIFKDGEADSWYSRNKEVLNDLGSAGSQLPLDIENLSRNLDPFKNYINRILEIGCSSGKKLETLCRMLDASGHGIEPSALAVEEGNSRMKDSQIQLVCGTADELPFESGSFDLVYFGFCLYLVDRQTLLKSLAEADRVLRAGGFLAITDFDPGRMYKRPYVHQEGLFSYKQDYSKFYTDSGLYYLVSKCSFSHRKDFFDHESDERVSLSLLFKEMDPYPLIRPSILS